MKLKIMKCNRSSSLRVALPTSRLHVGYNSCQSRSQSPRVLWLALIKRHVGSGNEIEFVPAFRRRSLPPVFPRRVGTATRRLPIAVVFKGLSLLYLNLFLFCITLQSCLKHSRATLSFNLNKPNRDSLACVFPRFAMSACIRFEF